MSIPARARSLLAPSEFPGGDYFASLPYPMLAAPGARALKLPSLPRSLELAPPQVFEDLRFEAAEPSASQQVELRFAVERAGSLRGLMVHVELFLLEGDASRPDVSSAEVGSHWPNVFLMLPEEVHSEPGTEVVVRASARLGGAQPRYSFEVTCNGAHAGTLEYPDQL